jgi:hypothetical protein
VEERTPATVVIKPLLTGLTLDSFIATEGITIDQIIAITEPVSGSYTLIFNGSAEQYASYHTDLIQESSTAQKVGQALDRTMRTRS